MATLTEDMKQFINDNLAFVATVSADGVPDLGPKMSMFALDDNHLAYRGYGAAGSASPWHGEGQGFESP